MALGVNAVTSLVLIILNAIFFIRLHYQKIILGPLKDLKQKFDKAAYMIDCVRVSAFPF